MSTSPATSSNWSPRCVAIYGVGLLGGSLGAALRQRAPATEIIGVGRDPIRLQGAVDQGLLTRYTTDPQSAAATADLLVFCTPVNQIASGVVAVTEACRPGTLITDVGSVKRPLADDLARLVGPVEYIGSHPLAGSEKRGYEHARAGLFEGRTCIVTPQADNDPEMVDRTIRFWTGLGMRVRTMSPQAHDEALANTSHLPHLIAAVLAQTLDASLIPFTGTGFRDTTRIAAGDPELWSAIFLANRDCVLDSLTSFQQTLALYRDVLDRADERQLRRLLAEAKYRRDLLASAGGDTRPEQASGNSDDSPEGNSPTPTPPRNLQEVVR